MSFLDEFDPDEEKVIEMERQAFAEDERKFTELAERCLCKVCDKQYWSEKWLAKHTTKAHPTPTQRKDK